MKSNVKSAISRDHSERSEGASLMTRGSLLSVLTTPLPLVPFPGDPTEK